MKATIYKSHSKMRGFISDLGSCSLYMIHMPDIASCLSGSVLYKLVSFQTYLVVADSGVLYYHFSQLGSHSNKSFVERWEFRVHHMQGQ